MNRLGRTHASGSSPLFVDLILKLVLTAAVLAAWVAGFVSLGGI